MIQTKTVLIAWIHGSLSNPKALEQISIFQIESCADQKIKINGLPKNRLSAQIPLEGRSHFRWLCNACVPNLKYDHWHQFESISTKLWWCQ